MIHPEKNRPLKELAIDAGRLPGIVPLAAPSDWDRLRSLEAGETGRVL